MAFRKENPGIDDELGGGRPNEREHSLGAMKAGQGPGSKSRPAGKIDQTTTSQYKGDGQVGRDFSTKPHPWWESKPGALPRGKSGSGRGLDPSTRGNKPERL